MKCKNQFENENIVVNHIIKLYKMKRKHNIRILEIHLIYIFKIVFLFGVYLFYFLFIYLNY